MATALASLLFGLIAGVLTFWFQVDVGARTLLLVGAAALAYLSWSGKGQSSWRMAVHCTAVVAAIANGMMLVLQV